MWAAMIALGCVLVSAGNGGARSPLYQETDMLQASGAPTRGASARTTPDEAKPFLGEWTAPVEALSGPATFLIDVKVTENKVLATVSSDLMGDSKVQDITNTDRGIALRYTGELWGYSAPVVLTLVPHGDQLEADFLLLNGQFTFSGVATKHQQ